MTAIIETGGKQYIVHEGDEIFVELLDAEKEVKFDKVLMVDGKTGTPYVKGAHVEATVLKHGKAPKIKIFRYVPKNRSSRKRQGHRQPYTKVKIEKIVK